MSTFSLVHGAWHGAWCWERLIPELERRGHRAIAVDLPCDDAACGTREYAEVVKRSLEGVDDDVVLVGHSAGGATIPLVAAARPVRRLTFLCAVVREPGKSSAELRATATTPTKIDMTKALYVRDDGASVWTDEALATQAMYHDCTPEDAHWAFGKLRPQFSTQGEINPLTGWPKAEYRYIHCLDDQIVSPDFGLRIAPGVLGVTPITMPGSHSPFLSRPSDLADVLTRGL